MLQAAHRMQTGAGALERRQSVENKWSFARLVQVTASETEIIAEQAVLFWCRTACAA